VEVDKRGRQHNDRLQKTTESDGVHQRFNRDRCCQSQQTYDQRIDENGDNVRRFGLKQCSQPGKRSEVPFNAFLSGMTPEARLDHHESNVTIFIGKPLENGLQPAR
jgi:hypothetical protein